MNTNQPSGSFKGTKTARRGSNQRGMRNYNERLILETIREHGELSKADLAKITGLSPQTSTIIANRLIEDGLLCKLSSVKGKVGQPRTPISLDANGAYSFGIKVGRRSVEIFLVDFCYGIIEQKSLRYKFAEPQPIFEWLCENISEIIVRLGEEKSSRILGIGLAQPFELENWPELIGAPAGTMESWKNFDLRNEIFTATQLPTFLLNDASAACLAELSLQIEGSPASFLYVYLGTFIGGGVVIEGKLLEGSTGNAGALASLPLNLFQSPQAQSGQLLEKASFNSLELWAAQQGLDADFLSKAPLTVEVETQVTQWISEAANGIAMAIIAGQAILDMNYVVLDSSLPQHLKERVASSTETALAQYDQRGISRPILTLGTLGNNARALGAALLPFRANFSADEAAFAIS